MLTKVLKNQVVGKSVKKTILKDVCTAMGHKHLLMVSPVKNHSVDCMGKIVTVNDFCKKKYSKSTNLLRGIIDQVGGKNALCEFGDNVHLKIKCGLDHKSMCKTPKNSCRNLGKLYAMDLELIRNSASEGILSCLYGASSDPK